MKKLHLSFAALAVLFTAGLVIIILSGDTPKPVDAEVSNNPNLPPGSNTPVKTDPSKTTPNKPNPNNETDTPEKLKKRRELELLDILIALKIAILEKRDSDVEPLVNKLKKGGLIILPHLVDTLKKETHPAIRRMVVSVMDDLFPNEFGDFRDGWYSNRKEMIEIIRKPENLKLLEEYQKLAVPTLIEVLEKDADQLTRHWAASALGQYGGKEAVAALIKLLKNGAEEGVLDWANTALNCAGRPDSFDILKQTYLDETFPERYKTSLIHSIGLVGTTESVEFLNTLLSSKHKWFVYAALGESGHPNAIQALMEIASSNDKEARPMAITTLARHYGRDKSVGDYLVTTLRTSTDDKIRSQILSSIGPVESKALLDYVFELFMTNPEDITLRDFLANQGDEWRRKAFEIAFQNATEDHERVALFTHFRISREEYQEKYLWAVKRVLENGTPQEKEWTVGGLACLKTKEARAILEAELDNAQTTQYKTSIINALVRQGGDGLIEKFQSALFKENDPQVKRALWCAINSLPNTEGAINALKNGLVTEKDHSIMIDIIEMLARRKVPDVVSSINHALSNTGDLNIQFRLIHALGMIGDNSAKQTLLSLLSERKHTAYALRALGISKLIEVSTLKHYLNDSDMAIRESAFVALTSLRNDKAAEDMLFEMLEASIVGKTDFSKQRILGGIGTVGGGRAIERLNELAKKTPQDDPFQKEIANAKFLITVRNIHTE